MARVSQEGIRCKCVIVGDGPLKDGSIGPGAGTGIVRTRSLRGFQADVRPYLQAASAFALTSRAEGLPLAVVEAMACGLPCWSPTWAAMRKPSRITSSGLVVPLGSVEAVAAAISFLVEHPQECAQMSRMARARACEIFDIEKCMADTEQVLLR